MANLEKFLKSLIELLALAHGPYRYYDNDIKLIKKIMGLS